MGMGRGMSPWPRQLTAHSPQLSSPRMMRLSAGERKRSLAFPVGTQAGPANSEKRTSSLVLAMAILARFQSPDQVGGFLNSASLSRCWTVPSTSGAAHRHETRPFGPR